MTGSEHSARTPWFDWRSPLYVDLFPDLIERLRSAAISNEDAVTEAVRRLQEFASRWFCRVDPSMRRDLAQDWLMRIHLCACQRYSRGEAAIRYIRAVAGNVQREAVRQRRHRSLSDEQAVLYQDDRTQDPLDRVLLDEAVATVSANVCLLSENQRAALARHYPFLLERSSLPEEQCPNDAVQRHRAVRRLRVMNQKKSRS